MQFLKKSFFLFIIIFSFSCNNHRNKSESINISPTETTPAINFTVVNSFPHDDSLFTEGFLFHNGQLFESTGSPNELTQTKSVIGIDDLLTGKFQKKIELDKSKYFGEGISFSKNKLYELTWKNHLCFVYDAKTFKLLDSLHYDNAEGWSLTSDGRNLIMSDGTNTLTYINPENFQPIKRLIVSENGTPLKNLNELEYINGFIYADIWQTNFIVKIDTSNGNVIGKLDMSSLVHEAQNKNPSADVLNGIAYDSAADKIYVTGKLWTNIYQVSFPH
jgi:glutamine cyclotransferase